MMAVINFESLKGDDWRGVVYAYALRKFSFATVDLCHSNFYFLMLWIFGNY
jgi:hypothetical protein